MKVTCDLCVSMLINQLIGIIKTDEIPASEYSMTSKGSICNGSLPEGGSLRASLNYVPTPKRAPGWSPKGNKTTDG